jgi:hypothetical protein
MNVIGHYLHSDNTNPVIAGNLFEDLLQPFRYFTNQEASTVFPNPDKMILQTVAAM